MELKVNEDAWRPKPGVINTEMIRKMVSKMLEDDVPGNNIDENEGYELHEVTHLYLEQLDILHIDHLWIMPALTVLKLTGNLIEKIENLETLVNLVDLNLSFNRIKVIENVEKLTKLEHFSLYSNLIKEIANLDKLVNLKIFTIGRNNVEDKGCILQLRKLNLFSLNMADNPCAAVEGFRIYVAAYMPKLEYYEYVKISQEERDTGRAKYIRELELLEREEADTGKVAKDLADVAAKQDYYSEAFVEGLDGHQLFDAMFDNDPSGTAMSLLGDEAVEIYQKFKEEIHKASTEIFNLGLEQLECRRNEINLFDQGVKDAIIKSRGKQRNIIEKFMENKSDTFMEMNDLLDVLTKETSEGSIRKSLEEKVYKANMMCVSVKKELLNLELILSEQLKELFALFERSLGDMVNLFIETAQGQFTLMREYETVFSEQIGDQASRFLTQLTIRNEDISTIAAPLRPIMVDKEAVNTAVATSHDVHLQIIDSREDQLMSRIRTWYHKLCADYEQEEIARFRGRVNEIVTFLEIQARDFQQYNINIDEDLFGFGDSN